MLIRRRRSAQAMANNHANAGQAVPPTPTPLVTARTAPNPAPSGTGTAHRIRLVPHLDSRRTLRFDPIARDLRASDTPIRIGRFTDRSGIGLAAVNALNTGKIAFKSKVVSRTHAEVFVEDGPPGSNPKFWIRDTKSSSGTFVNHVRLSAAGTESRPFQIKDGDILQLGVDYQGGAEDIYKSVKIRIEVGREWQAAANAFNTAALQNLRTLAIAPTPDAGPSTGEKKKRKGLAASGIPDCCICLFPVTIRQALFLAPCSHAFHYKCLRPLLAQHHPAFSCPLCRSFADLEEDVEVELEEDEDDDLDVGDASAITPHPDHPGAQPLAEEGVLSDDMDDGDEVDELFPSRRFRPGGGGGAETEVEDNGMQGIIPGAFVHSRRRSANFDMMDDEPGGSGEFGAGRVPAHARPLSYGDETLNTKRKR
ncbi:putative E3 ubiquitin-protein ligase dma1 [Mycena kentingensis (nom. inval.)]|nr:putative E3 ubiquitin-protein ligase dma1 [Mycena kentingensis (nom. inval.)]